MLRRALVGTMFDIVVVVFYRANSGFLQRWAARLVTSDSMALCRAVASRFVAEEVEVMEVELATTKSSRRTQIKSHEETLQAKSGYLKLKKGAQGT